MPYAKVLPIRSAAALSGKIAYLSDTSHANHLDKTVEGLSLHGVQSTAEFLAKTVATVREINERRRRGRKIRNLVDEVIIRTPDLSNLSASERDTFVKNILTDFCPDSPAVAAWHLDKYNGSCDVHIIVANFIDVYPAKTRRSSAFNNIAVVRATSDRITDILNVRRRENGVAPIVTMADVRKQNLKQRGLATLAAQIAPMLPFSTADLPDKIASLGHKVTRYNAKGNTVSVCLSGASKAHRFFVDKLLADAACLAYGVPSVVDGGIVGVYNNIEM